MIVQVQALDGTWENLGIDREHGIVPESIQLVSEGGSPTQASFSIRRDPTRYYPDLQGLAPIRFREMGEDQWTGFIRETPSDDVQVTVQCVGGGLYGDLDPYEFRPVIIDLSAWKDNRSLLTEDLHYYTTFGTVATDGGIYLAFPGALPGGVAGTLRQVGVMIDLGEQRAAGLALDLLASSAPVSNQVTWFYVRPTNTPTGITASADDWGIPQSAFYYGAGVGAQTFVRRFVGRYRYIHLFLYYAGGAWTQQADDMWLRISRAEVYADPTFESGGWSALTADKLVSDAARRVSKWLPMSWSPAKFSDLVLAHPTLHRYHRFNETGPTLKLLDNFSAGLGNWTMVSTSAASTAGGVLTPTAGTSGGIAQGGFVMTYNGLSTQAWRFTRKINVGATVGSPDFSIILKWVDSNNFFMLQRLSTDLVIRICSGGTLTLRAQTNGLPALAANTSYWQRATIEGDTFLLEWFNSDPATGNPTPVGTCFYELTNAAEATNHGAGANGYVGVRDQIVAGYTFDDYRIEDFTVPMVVKDHGPQGWDAHAQAGVIAGQGALMTPDADDPGNASIQTNMTLGRKIRYPYNSGHGWNLSGSFTIEAVFSLDSLPPAGTAAPMLEHWGGAVTGQSLNITVNQNGALNVSWYGLATTSTPNGTIVAGKTYHMMFTFDLAEAKAGLTSARLYINGALTASSAYPATGASLGMPDLTDYPHFCQIAFGDHFDGSGARRRPMNIDELAIYRGALRDHDASNHYDAAILRTVGDSKRTATPIPSYAELRDKSANEHIAAANALHGFQFRVGPDLLPIFRPLPSAPTLEVGDWDGSKFADTSQTGIEVVNKVRGNAQDALGNPLRATRYAAGVGIPYAASIAQPSNPSAAVDVSDWSADHPGVDLDWARSFSAAVIGSSWAADTGAALSRDTSAGNVLTAPASFLVTAGPGTAVSAGSFKITTAQKLVPGRRYRVDLLMKPRAVTGNFFLGARVVVAGRQVAAYLQWNIVLSTVSTALVGLEFVATEPATSYTVQVGWIRLASQASVPLFDFDAVTAYESTDDSIPGRRGLTVSKSLQVSNRTTQAVLDRMCDLYLATHQQVPFKGSLTAQPGGVRELGVDVDPITLLGRGGEMMRFGHLTDPQTLAQGRNGRMTTVTYDHGQRQSTVAIDSTRDDFGTLLGRMGVQSS